MQRNNETKTIGSLIEASVFADNLKKDKMQEVIKQSTVFSFWSDIAGKKFKDLSIPYLIKGSNLYVAVKSPVILQELSLNKKLLINKVNSYSLPLGIKIVNIVFDYKKFDEINFSKMDNLIEDRPLWYSNCELEKVNLDKDFEQKILNSISKIKFLDASQKQKLAKKIFLTYKAKILGKINIYE